MAASTEDPLRQMNVRVPTSLVAAIDAARGATSRDKWVAANLAARLPATTREDHP